MTLSAPENEQTCRPLFQTRLSKRVSGMDGEVTWTPAGCPALMTLVARHGEIAVFLDQLRPQPTWKPALPDRPRTAIFRFYSMTKPVDGGRGR